MDLTMVNLDDVLPQATIMVVSVTASTTSGQPLPAESLKKVLDAADSALQIDEDKGLILKLVQQKMHKIAPNLSAAVGTEIAARLMGVAGGLINLSKMPACNVQVVCCWHSTIMLFLLHFLFEKDYDAVCSITCIHNKLAARKASAAAKIPPHAGRWRHSCQHEFCWTDMQAGSRL